MEIDAKRTPRSRSFEGLCSALKGVIRDSRTMRLSSFFALYKPFGSLKLGKFGKNKGEKTKLFI